VKYLKLFKLFRMGRVIKLFVKYAKYSGVLQLFLLFIVLLHMGGCFTAYYLGDRYPFNDPDQDFTEIYLKTVQLSSSAYFGDNIILKVLYYNYIYICIIFILRTFLLYVL
jgi:hypothetical protein